MIDQLPSALVCNILDVVRSPLPWTHTYPLLKRRSSKVLQTVDHHSTAATCKALRDACYQHGAINVEVRLPSATTIRTICPEPVQRIQHLKLVVNDRQTHTKEQLSQLLTHAEQHLSSQLASVQKLTVEAPWDAASQLDTDLQRLLQLVTSVQELKLPRANQLDGAALSKLTRLTIQDIIPFDLLPGLVNSVPHLQYLNIELHKTEDCPVTRSNMSPLGRLRQLTHLEVRGWPYAVDMSVWPCLPSLTSLTIDIYNDTVDYDGDCIDLSPLPSLAPRLQTLVLMCGVKTLQPILRYRVILHPTSFVAEPLPESAAATFTFLIFYDDYYSYSEHTLEELTDNWLLPPTATIAFANGDDEIVWYEVDGEPPVAGPNLLRRANVTKLGLSLEEQGDTAAVMRVLMGIANAQVPVKHLLINGYNQLMRGQYSETTSFLLPLVEELSIAAKIDTKLLRWLLKQLPGLRILRLPLDPCESSSTASDAMLLSAVRGTPCFVRPRTHEPGVYDVVVSQ